jgi:hypothetical protein
MERKIDWTVSRRKVEIGEQLADKGITKLRKVRQICQFGRCYATM